MAFSLLGRTVDGMLSLLSSQTFESRQDALAELGRITGDPAFTSWDDEVMLIDLDRGTPVLLVRPTTPAPVIEPDMPAHAKTALEPAAFAVIADEEPAVEPALLAEPDPDDVPELELEEVEPDAAVAVIAADATDAASETPQATRDEVGIEAVDAAVTPEVDPVTASDAIAESETEPGSAASEMDSLRAAIARTTQQMEASGVVAPDSIAGATADHEEEPAAEAESPVEEAAVSEAVEAPAVTEPSSSGPWPWSTRPRQKPDEEATDDKIPDVDVAFLLEGIEEPSADDGGSLITSSIDAASLAASRPMILGAYGESPAQPSAEAEVPEAEAAAPEVEIEETAPAASIEIDEPAEESDFIVLEFSPEEVEVAVSDTSDGSEVTVVAAVPTSQPAEDVLSLSAYTCDDCVYVETCPNTDQRRPQDCGSFQWK